MSAPVSGRSAGTSRTVTLLSENLPGIPLLANSDPCSLSAGKFSICTCSMSSCIASARRHCSERATWFKNEEPISRRQRTRLLRRVRSGCASRVLRATTCNCTSHRQKPLYGIRNQKKSIKKKFVKRLLTTTNRLWLSGTYQAGAWFCKVRSVLGKRRRDGNTCENGLTHLGTIKIRGSALPAWMASCFESDCHTLEKNCLTPTWTLVPRDQ